MLLLSENNVPKRIYTAIFIILSSVLFIYKYQVLLHFSFIYIDADQVVMWNGLQNFSNGNFHEPCFYGQSYSSMLEALLAVPGSLLGFEAHHVLPVTTLFLSLFPVYLMAYITFQKISYLSGIAIICFMFTFSYEYDVITTLPRGFVTGIAMSSLMFLFLYHPSRINIFIAGLSMIIGYSLNPNSILLSFPLILIIIKDNYRNIALITGIASGLLFHSAVKLFYYFHPEYIVHSFELKYILSKIPYGIMNTDKLFHAITPVFWNAHFLVLPFLLLISFILFYTKKNFLGIVFFVLTVLIIMTFGVSKIYDGTNSVFFSYSRMYLALPLIFGLIFYCIPIKKLAWFLLIFSISLTVLIYKWISIDKLNEMLNGKDSVIGVTNINQIKDDCHYLNQLFEKYDVSLIIINNHWMREFYAYGCSSCEQNFPSTLIPDYDRRTWRFMEEEKKIHSNIIIIDLNNNFNANNRVQAIPELKGYYLLKGNRLNAIQLLKQLDISVRKYK